MKLLLWVFIHSINVLWKLLFLFETSITNVTRLLYWTLIAPFIVEDEEMMYDRGVYKGEDKRWIALKKSIPLINQQK